MKTLTLCGAAAVLVLMGACAPTGPSGDAGSPLTIPETSAACGAEGGIWRREGRLGTWMCVMPYADAGRSCTDGAQCRGDCRLADDERPPAGAAVTGVCQADTSRFGCFTRVENGRAAATLCVD